MPKWFVYVTLSVIVLAMIPPAIIARARTRASERPRIHIIQDMDNQAKRRAQHDSPLLPDGRPLFADGRSMRPPVAGAVARDELALDDHFERGLDGGGWAETFPEQAPLTRALIERGRGRFVIYCSVCHGLAGYGDGMVHQRAAQLMNHPNAEVSQGTVWVQPKSLHDPEVRVQPVGQLFNTVTNGVRTMSGYAAQIPVPDRWAIVAYVTALQRSQNATLEDVPPGERQSLPLVDLIPEEETE